MLFYHLFYVLIFSKEITYVVGNSEDWRTIENLAESHPYVVAILNLAKDCMCSGTIIGEKTVLTSGGCINPKPHYIAVGSAVFNNKLNKSLIPITYTKTHGDYIFDVQETELKVNRMNSNIGLIFVLRPVLNLYLESAIIGNYYASELKEKKLVMVGFGYIRTSNIVVLQQQAYQQTGCMNPTWYYCICGIEYFPVSYEESFGEGAPVLLDETVVAIAATPSGSLTLKKNINYNIFTVIAPYSRWIEKSISDTVVELKIRSSNCASCTTNNVLHRIYFIVVFINYIGDDAFF